MVEVKVKKVHKDAQLPKIATQGSACFDLHCVEDFVMSNGCFFKARTGLVFEIPTGFCIEVLPRSGMGARGIIIPNSPGIIDSDYRGEVMVMLYGLFIKSHEIFTKGSRIAQCRIVPVTSLTFKEVSEVTDTRRGAGGFGSTGK